MQYGHDPTSDQTSSGPAWPVVAPSEGRGQARPGCQQGPRLLRVRQCRLATGKFGNLKAAAEGRGIASEATLTGKRGLPRVELGEAAKCRFDLGQAPLQCLHRTVQHARLDIDKVCAAHVSRATVGHTCSRESKAQLRTTEVAVACMGWASSAWQHRRQAGCKTHTCKANTTAFSTFCGSGVASVRSGTLALAQHECARAEPSHHAAAAVRPSSHSARLD